MIITLNNANHPSSKKKPFIPVEIEVDYISPDDIIHTSGHSNDLFLDFNNNDWDSQWGN